jgi:hypothetical protein
MGMSREEKKARLQAHLQRAAALGYERLARLQDSIVESHGSPGTPDFYTVSTSVLEKNRDSSGDWLHVLVSLDSDSPIISRSVTGSAFVYSDGRIEYATR